MKKREYQVRVDDDRCIIDCYPFVSIVKARKHYHFIIGEIRGETFSTSRERADTTLHVELIEVLEQEAIRR